MLPRISPSILSADFANLQADLDSIIGADLVHVDVMDGHFVPNLTIGLPVVRRISEVTELPLDVHLMIENPDLWAAKYAEFSHSVTFHYEAAIDPQSTISSIRAAGAKVALAIRPNTAFEDIAHLCADLDMLLVMTVEPGFGGQKLIDKALEKVSLARSFADQEGLSLSLQVDGGVTVENISSIARAGADTFVAGTAVFEASNRSQRIEELRALAITL
jgi:ribulose-phosphate 3-epimerase